MVVLSLRIELVMSILDGQFVFCKKQKILSLIRLYV
jgi:hypothetical protein